MSRLTRAALWFLAAAVSMTLLAGNASAAVSWWHVNTVSAPASVPGGEDRLVLEVTNLGDAPVDGFTNPVTIVDQLPAGVTPTHVYGDGGGSFGVGVNGVQEVIQCKFAGQKVTCTYAGPLLAYERFVIAMTVNITAPGAGEGTSEVSVTGGGTAPVVSSQPLALSESPGAFGPERYEMSPEEEGGGADTQAGSHPFQLTTTLTFHTKSALVYNYFFKEELPEVQPVAMAKDVRFVLPPGLVGNPTALPKCSLAVFVKQSSSTTSTHCPDDTAIGVATPIVDNLYIDHYTPLAVTVPVFNVEPAVGEPARFGFITPLGPVVLDTSVRTGSNYAVVVTAPDIPSDLGFLGSQVTFWGVPGDSRHDTSRGSCLDEREGSGVHEITKWEFACPVQGKPQPFLIMPASCTGVLHTSIEGDSWEDIGQFTSSREYPLVSGSGQVLAQDGCNRLNFDPSIVVKPDGQQGSTATGLTVAVHVDQESSLNPTGLADATVKDTTVALPVGVELDSSGADGLSACSTGQIALQSSEEQACPEASKVGTVEITTPLLPNPLTGAVYLATQNANPFDSLVALYIVARDPVSGVLVKIAGEVKVQKGTGQLISTFRETPQLPFENLTLHFFGGSRAPLGTPALCGSYTTTASIAPWSGNLSAQIASPPFTITSAPNGAPCANPLPFQPSLTAGSSNIQAGAFTPFTMTMSREDGNQDLKGVQLKLPPGLLGSIASVKLCDEANADAGTCGPESLIGHTTVSVGLGGNPYTVTGGQVFITGPYEGAPYGLSIVNPAKAGPFDLEHDTSKPATNMPACDCIVVRAKIEVDPITSALTVTSDTSGAYEIPPSIDNVPLQIKHVNVTVDRPGFTFNPTNCGRMGVGGALTSGQGAVSAVNVPFQVTNCATLGFKPSFQVTTAAKTSRRIGASLHVKLRYPKAPFGSQANIAQVKVDLPKLLPSRLSTLQKACPDHTFNVNPAACPSASRVGTAAAVTPVLPDRLSGPAYFVSHGGAKFPELVVVLSGDGVTVDLHGETFINEKTNVTSSTFRAVPDVPVGTFELTLPQGPNSALAAVGNLCSKKLKMPTSFVAANGKAIHRTTVISTTGCPKHKP